MTRPEIPKWQLALAIAVCLASIALLVARIHYGFLPEDDPAVSYLGERTLQGGLPNVDFYDNYTGGLSFLNALALRVFGLRMISLRFMLLLFFVPWIATVWYISSRITSSINAILLTLLAAVWSVPVYPTPYATWYNLYFAIFGTVAIFRFIDTRRRRWMFWAGVCGGLSFLAKIFGLYFVAAAGLFLLFDEQQDSATPDNAEKVRWSAYSVFLTCLVVAFVAAITHLINTADRSDVISGVFQRYYHFVLPTGAIGVFLIYSEWASARTISRKRFLGSATRLAPFSLGVAVPILIFLVPYVSRHAVGQWLAAVLLARGRVEHSSNPPASNAFLLLTVPLLLFLLINSECRLRNTRKVVTAILSVILGLLLILGVTHRLASGLEWFSIAEALPLLVVIAVVVIARKSLHPGKHVLRLLILVFVAAMMGLVQFPFAAPIYFLFVAPIVFLLLVALVEETKGEPKVNLPLIPVIAFYLLFGVAAILPGQFYISRFDKTPESAFSLPRAEGFVGDRDAVDLYQQLAAEVSRHAGTGPIYAGPDSPGLYFLTGHQNPTIIYMDFLAGTDALPQSILHAVDIAGVQIVIINHGEFKFGPASYNPSGPPPSELLAGLRVRFPQSKNIGFYEVRWK